MIKLNKLMKHPETFKRLSGVSPEQFSDLEQKLRPLWINARKQELNRADRQRAMGGECLCKAEINNFSFSIENR